MPYWTFVMKKVFFRLPNVLISRYVPTKNKYKYCTNLESILETHRVDRDRLIALNCRCTHQIKPKSIYVNENDALYNIYALRVGQQPAFMRNLLKMYVDMYCQQFKHVGATYMKSKSLDFDHWWDSIKDGHKGDIMVLLGLNYLMGTHTTVHLKDNCMWSTLHGNFTHDELVNQSNFHLVYLGWGIYAELIKRQTPLSRWKWMFRCNFPGYWNINHRRRLNYW